MPAVLVVIVYVALAVLGGLVARALALGRSGDPVEPRWFGLAQAIHALVLAAWLGWLLALPAAIRALVAGIASPFGAFAPMAGAVALVLPPLVVTIALSIMVHDVARRLRTSDLPWSNVLRQTMWFAVILLGPALAGGMIAGDLARNDVRGALPWIAPAVLALALGSRGLRRAAEFVPQAVTHGDLRDAVFGLAARARVALTQLYVVPMRRSRLANAFAVSDRTVILTDYLLARLDRAEVDAVLAHEVAHLQLGHPRKLGLTRAFSLAIPMVMAWYEQPVAWTLAAAVAGILFSMAFSRRCEFAADARALALGARPEALISGLARITRLNFMPGRWARGLAPFLTHPALDVRAHAIARHGALAPERAAEAQAPPPEPGAGYELPVATESDAKLFDSSFKAGRVATLTASLLTVATLAPIAAFSAATWLGAPVPRMAWVPLGALATFGALCLATDWLAPRSLGGLRERLTRRLPRPWGPGAWFVGLSPDANPRVYEGFSNWDAGILAIGKGRLEYAGGECRFALTPGQIVDLRLARGFPSWVPNAVVLLRWRDPSGPEGALRLSPADLVALHRSRPAARGLLAALERWRAEGEYAGPGIGGASALPPHTPVTGAAPGASVNAAYAVSVAVSLAFFTAIAYALLRLPFASLRGPGWTDAFGAALIATLAMSVPHVRHRDEPAPERPQETMRPAA